MKESKVREPMQQRSIAKKKKIIDAGYDLFIEKGYHGTNTAEIAKRAGVSTGIVYNYFHNKKEIFMVCLERYAEMFAAPVYTLIGQVTCRQDLIDALQGVIDTMIEAHVSVQTLEDEFTAMQFEDPDVAAYYKKYEEVVTERLAEILNERGIRDAHLHEKIHIIYNLVENLCHEVSYHRHDCMDADVMIAEVMEIITFMINNMEE